MKEIPLRLRDMETFFEGIVPSIIATSSADGIPNVSYLSHVVLVDDERVGLSNQFFNTTMANLAENPKAAILLVDGARGGQCRLRAVYEKTVFDGPLFSRVSTQLDATSAQVGMAGIMRLRGVISSGWSISRSTPRPWQPRSSRSRANRCSRQPPASP